MAGNIEFVVVDGGEWQCLLSCPTVFVFVRVHDGRAYQSVAVTGRIVVQSISGRPTYVPRLREFLLGVGCQIPCRPYCCVIFKQQSKQKPKQ